jgi:hypothetical protein
MTSIVTDFKSIRQKLERQEQKAEYEAKEAEQRASYAGLYLVPFEGVKTGGTSAPMDLMGASRAGRLTGGSCDAVTLATAQLPPYTPSLKSMAHPEWPYAGTPFEWSKFVKVKI